MIDHCSNPLIETSPIINEVYNFTSDYEIRIYRSACYYLDESNQWKTDGLRVGNKTNFNETQCFFTLT